MANLNLEVAKRYDYMSRYMMFRHRIAMKKYLSTSWTLIEKIIPYLAVAYGLYRLVSDFQNIDIFAVIFYTIFVVVWYLATYKLKRVYLEDENLYVANYLKWVRIPLTEVDGIGTSWWNGERWNHPRITLTLKAPSEFGDRIVFSPKGIRLKKAADELRQLIEERTNRQLPSWHSE